MCYKRVDSEGKVDRGCFSSLKPEHQNVCKDEKDKTCQICDSGETCNGGVFPEDRLKCVKCPNEKDCKGNGQVPGYCNLYDADDKCATFFSGFVLTKKACLSELSDDDKKVCNDENDAACATCKGDSCNKDNIRTDDECIECDQEKDTNCLALAEDITSNKCSIGNEGRCFTTITGKKMVKRGCYAKLTGEEKPICDNENDESCAVCNTGNGCNNAKKFPANRLTCNQCDGESCDEDLKAHLCELFEQGDKCVTLFDGLKVTKRACRSSLGKEFFLCLCN